MLNSLTDFSFSFNVASISASERDLVVPEDEDRFSLSSTPINKMDISSMSGSTAELRRDESLSIG